MDKKNLENHIRGDDYLGTTATKLDLFRQELDKSFYRQEYSKLLKEIVDELMFIQNNYRIIKKK